MKKNTTLAPWIKAGAKVLITKWDPFRYNPPSDVLDSAKEVTIEKVGTKFFYIGGTAYDKVSLKPNDGGFSKQRVFRDRDDIFEFIDTRIKTNHIRDGVDKLTPAQVKLIHAIMFPHDTTLWDKDQVEDSLETIEWYGLASAMFPGSKLDKVGGGAIHAAKEPLNELPRRQTGEQRQHDRRNAEDRERKRNAEQHEDDHTAQQNGDGNGIHAFPSSFQLRISSTSCSSPKTIMKNAEIGMLTYVQLAGSGRVTIVLLALRET